MNLNAAWHETSVSTADRRKSAPGNPSEGEDFNQGRSPKALPVAVLRGFPCSVGQLLPVAKGQLDELAAQCLELGGTVVVLDVLREVRDGVDQAIALRSTSSPRLWRP
jgi:hypothetical protein